MAADPTHARPQAPVVGTSARRIGRDQWLALGLLLAALLLGYLILVHPWFTAPMLEVNDRIEGLQQRELRQRMQLQQAPQVQQRLALVRAQQARSPGFLPESSAELATAGLVQRLERVVAEASPGNRSCAISNRSPLSEPRRDRYARVVVQVRLRCGTPELMSVLYALEAGTPRLFVGNLNLLSSRGYFLPGANQPSGDGGLDVTFDLYGYLRPSPNASTEVPRAPR